MRKLLAVWAAKLASAAGRLIGKKSSSSPGLISLKICPNLIKILSRGIEKGIIVTCGTNGKTTTNNLLYSTLRDSGYRVVCNALGANMLGGIATTFAQECSLTGRLKADFACLEIDEASAVRVFDHLTPDAMIITNLFRDQLDRYGEIDITADLLRRAIGKAPGIKLILNGDDPLTAQFGRGREGVYYFGIDEQVLPQTDDTREGRFCAVCGAEQEYRYYHYSQLGDYHCPKCGNSRPALNFAARSVDLKDGLSFTINDGAPLRLHYRGFYNIYNILAVYAAIHAVGIKAARFNEVLASYKPQIGRMEEIDLGKPVILNLAKNPAGFNQAISTVLQDTRKKDVIIAINDNANDGHDVSWLWDVDFENLRGANLNTLVTTGIRRYDMSLSFKYCGVKTDGSTDDMRQAILDALKTPAEVCYILVNYTVLFSTENIMLALKKELEGKQ